MVSDFGLLVSLVVLGEALTSVHAEEYKYKLIESFGPGPYLQKDSFFSGGFLEDLFGLTRSKPSKTIKRENGGYTRNPPLIKPFRSPPTFTSYNRQKPPPTTATTNRFQTFPNPFFSASTSSPSISNPSIKLYAESVSPFSNPASKTQFSNNPDSPFQPVFPAYGYNGAPSTASVGNPNIGFQDHGWQTPGSLSKIQSSTSSPDKNPGPKQDKVFTIKPFVHKVQPFVHQFKLTDHIAPELGQPAHQDVTTRLVAGIDNNAPHNIYSSKSAPEQLQKYEDTFFKPLEKKSGKPASLSAFSNVQLGFSNDDHSIVHPSTSSVEQLLEKPRKIIVTNIQNTKSKEDLISVTDSVKPFIHTESELPGKTSFHVFTKPVAEPVVEDDHDHETKNVSGHPKEQVVPNMLHVLSDNSKTKLTNLSPPATLTSKTEKSGLTQRLKESINLELSTPMSIGKLNPPDIQKPNAKADSQKVVISDFPNGPEIAASDEMHSKHLDFQKPTTNQDHRGAYNQVVADVDNNLSNGDAPEITKPFFLPPLPLSSSISDTEISFKPNVIQSLRYSNLSSQPPAVNTDTTLNLANQGELTNNASYTHKSLEEIYIHNPASTTDRTKISLETDAKKIKNIPNKIEAVNKTKVLTTVEEKVSHKSVKSHEKEKSSKQKKYQSGKKEQFTSFPYRGQKLNSGTGGNTKVSDKSINKNKTKRKNINIEEMESKKADSLKRLLAIAGKGWDTSNGSKGRDEFKCPEPEGHFGSSSACGVYYRCVHGRPTRMTCGAGLAWNAGTGQCDWVDQVGCGLNRVPRAGIS